MSRENVVDLSANWLLTFPVSSLSRRKEAQAYSRRSSKLATNVCSLFTSAFVYHWSEYFDTAKPQYPPVFDGRTVLYPSDHNMRDYLSWRQADCHINNLYNTTFWALVLKGGLTPHEVISNKQVTLLPPFSRRPF